MQADSLFIRNRIPLSEWLWRLVSECKEERMEAGEILQDMVFAIPDFDHREKQFSQAVKRVLASPDFNTAKFVRMLCERKLAVDRGMGFPFESLSHTAVRISAIFDMLGSELLAARDTLMEMMQLRRPLSDAAIKAITRVGPGGREFFPWLIAELDAGTFQYPKPHALSAIIDSDNQLLAELIERLSIDVPHRRIGAANVLAHLGPKTGERAPDILRLLEPMTQRDDEKWSAYAAISSVGRQSPEVRGRILEMARNQTRHAESMMSQGYALSLLTYFVDSPEECAPVLIEALQTFEEFDPDESYAGPAGRIADVLEVFGPAAAAAALPLAQLLENVDWREDYPSAILRALLAMGPSAQEAVPVLEEARKSYFKSREEVIPELDGRSSIDKEEDPVGWTLARIAEAKSGPGIGHE